MNSLITKFKENLKVCNIKNGQTIILAVSGGIDSVTMLDLFLSVKKDYALKLVVAHLNHSVREDSDTDERFVKSLAKKNKLTFVSKKINPSKTGNLEEELRNERKIFLSQCAESFNADYISLAHNKNDQAETFFLNLIRGSGPAGLSAMNLTDGKNIRPLLNISRDDIKNYAEKKKLEWHEDSTNKDVRYSRNLLRLKILPELEKINPEWLENIFRTAQIQREIDVFMKKEAGEIIKNKSTLDVNQLKKLEDPLLFEILGISYERKKGDRKELSLKNLQDLKNLIQKTGGTKKLNLPKNITAVRSYANLDFLAKKEDNKEPVLLHSKAIKIGKTVFNDWVITAKVAAKSTTPDKETIFIELDSLKDIEIRTRKSGDKIVIEGVGTKKLQDIFVDSKVDLNKRKIWPVVYDRNEDKIIWIPGLESTRRLLPEKNRNIIKLTAKEVLDEKANKI